MKNLTWKEQIKEVMDTLIPYCGTANIEPRVEDIISICETEIKVSRVDAEVKPASTEHQIIYNMALHQVIDISEIDNNYRPFRYVMRVAGGWIYANYDTDKDIYTDKLFVAFDNDMQKTELPY
jgi:hypothetical protein